jgi:hypothetical protein
MMQCLVKLTCATGISAFEDIKCVAAGLVEHNFFIIVIIPGRLDGVLYAF